MHSESIPDDKDCCQEEEHSPDDLDDDVADEGKLHAVIADVDVAPVAEVSLLKSLLLGVVIK